jgi:hypothetical protein
LTYILKGDEARPITRLIKGTHYALGILVSARRITGHLHREALALAPQADHDFIWPDDTAHYVKPYSIRTSDGKDVQVAGHYQLKRQLSLFEAFDGDHDVIFRGDHSGDGEPW